MQRPEGRGDPSWQYKVPFPDTFTAPYHQCGWLCSFLLLLGPLNPYFTAWYIALLVGRSSASGREGPGNEHESLPQPPWELEDGLGPPMGTLASLPH